MCNAFYTWQSLKASFWVSGLPLSSIYRCYLWIGIFHSFVTRWTDGKIFKAEHKSAPVIISDCAFFHPSSIHFASTKFHTQQLSFCLFKLSTLYLSVLYGYNFWQALASSVTSHLHSPLYNILLYISSPLLTLSWMMIFFFKCTDTIQDICSPHSQYRTSQPLTIPFSFGFTLLNLSSS